MLTYSYISSITLSKLTEETELKAESISKDVRNIFENANIVTDQMALHHNIQMYLKTVKTRNDIIESPYYKNVFDALVDIQNSDKTHFLSWVANEEANFYIDSLGNVSGEDYDVRIRPWYDVAVNAEGTAFTPPYVEWLTRRVVISSIKALRHNQEIYGFVVVDIVLEDIPSIFESERQGLTDLSFLITGDGTYVYHVEKEKIINAKYTDEGDQLSEYQDVIESSTKELVDIKYHNKNYFLTSYPVDDRGWKVITLIDKSKVDEQIIDLTTRVSILFFVGLGSCILLVYLLVRKSTKPYTVLVEHGKDIAAGDLSKNIPEFYLGRVDEMGDLSNSFQTIIDTFRKENDTLEQKIIEKNNELEAQYQHILESEKAASLGNLVAGIAHEINTPIGTSLSASTYLERVTLTLKEKYELGTLSKKDFLDYMGITLESLDILINSLERAAAMISSFKQVAVDQSSEMKYRFDLRESLEGVILSLRHEYKRTKHTLINNCDDGIEIDSYPGAFGQILTNLIMNSLKHGFSNKEEGTIRIWATENKGSLKITYEDNGVGMHEDVMNNMYEPFFTTNRAAGNSGLGMHIVYNIVTQKLKGTIKCESVLGEGVKFIIDVPVSK